MKSKDIDIDIVIADRITQEQVLIEPTTENNGLCKTIQLFFDLTKFFICYLGMLPATRPNMSFASCSPLYPIKTE